MIYNPVLGAIIGDMVGVPYEFLRYGAQVKPDFPLWKDESTFSDDSVMTLAVAKWLLESEDFNYEDEKELGDLFIEHYKSLNINPLTKTLVMSNALNFLKFKEIRDYFAGRINVVAGIGTNLTNDCGVVPLNEVMKLIECQEHEGAPKLPCIKRSDDKGKRLGNAVQHDVLDHILSNAS